MDARKRRKVIAIALAIAMPLALIGQTMAVEQSTNDYVTTGHSSFLSASTSFNSCFAGVSGLLLQRVTWFNGQTLFQRASDGGGNTWVYFTEHFVDNGFGYDKETGIEINDPSQEKLFETDNTYKFEVPNHPDKTWVVQEYFALRQVSTDAAGDTSPNDPGAGAPKRVYVFAVKIADRTFDLDDNLTMAEEFNFVGVVDTCRFHGSAVEEDRQHDNGIEGDSGDPSDQHDSANLNGETHPHDVYSIDLWVGGPPDSVPCLDTGDGQEQCVPDDRSGEDEDPSAGNDARDGSP